MNGKLSYSILRGDGFEAFDIDSSTGLITTNANLDQLTQSEVTLKIRARDSPDTGVPRWVNEDATVTVSVNFSQVFVMSLRIASSQLAHCDVWWEKDRDVEKNNIDVLPTWFYKRCFNVDQSTLIL